MSSLSRTARNAILRAGAVAVCVALAGSASGQAMPDLNLRALGWLRGRWAAPIVCEAEGRLVETAHRLVILPAPKHIRPPANRIDFHGVELEGASRCTGTLGADSPDIGGSLRVTLPGMSRPDLAQAEFTRTLRQDGGFDFEVVSGRLRLTGWGESAEPRIVDFAGGMAKVREVRRGSDAARILAEIRSPRKLTFELQSADGAETLAFPMVFYDFR